MFDALTGYSLVAMKQAMALAGPDGQLTHRELVFILFTVAIFAVVLNLMRRILEPIGMLVAALGALAQAIGAILVAAVAGAATIAFLVAFLYNIM
jgi:hypothetical protein